MADISKAPIPIAGEVSVYGTFDWGRSFAPWLPGMAPGSRYGGFNLVEVPDAPYEEPAPAPEAPETPQEDPVDEVVVTADRPPPAPLPSPPEASPAMLGFYGAVQGARPAPRRRPAPKPRPRRSKPAPKPSRRQRPTTKPRPGGPRIPIPLPPVARAMLGRLLGVLSLVPTYLGVLKAVDQFGTEGWYERIYGVPYSDRDNQRSGSASSNVGGPARADNYIGGEIVVSAARPLQEVVVTGRAPARVPVPAFVPGPLDLPFVSPSLPAITSPEAVPEPERRPVSEPTPSFSPQPIPNLVPQPGLFPDPALEPSPAPAPNRKPSPVPSLPNVDVPIVTVNPTLMPTMPAAEPQPVSRADPCNCPKPKGKDKKPKKKRKEREKCYRGSYTEHSKGLTKRRREEVDCKTGKPKAPPAAANEDF